MLAEVDADRKCQGDINVKDWTERDAPEVKDSNQVNTYKQNRQSNIYCSKDVSRGKSDYYKTCDERNSKSKEGLKVEVDVLFKVEELATIRKGSINSANSILFLNFT